MFAPGHFPPRPPFSSQPSGATYTLVCAVGTFTLTGQTVAFKAGRTLVCDYGGFTLSGQDVAFKAGRKLVCDVGTFSLSGQDARLAVGRNIAADVGLFSLTGQDADFVYTPRTTIIDTHDGVEDVRKKHRERDEGIASARKRLRELLEHAWDGPQTETAEEIKVIASPHVEQLESGRLQIDYEALATRITDLLELEAKLRAEQDDEDVMILLWS